MRAFERKLLRIIIVIAALMIVSSGCGGKSKDKIVRSTATGTSTRSPLPPITGTGTLTNTATFTGTSSGTGTATTITGSGTATSTGTGTATTNTGSGTSTSTGTGELIEVYCYVTGEQYSTGYLDTGIKKDDIIWTYHKEGDLKRRKGFIKFDVSALPSDLTYDRVVETEVAVHVTRIGSYGGFTVLRVAPVTIDPVISTGFDIYDDYSGAGAGNMAGAGVVLDQMGWNYLRLSVARSGIFLAQQRLDGLDWFAMKFYGC